jgi:hypothetical protein
MNSRDDGSARAVADFAEGSVVASVEIAASPERVFLALASKEIVDWWVRPGVFDTREWSGDVRVGGRWRLRDSHAAILTLWRVSSSRSIRPENSSTRGASSGRPERPQR